MRDEANIQNCDPEFLFRYPREWQKLKETDIEGIRFCNECSKKVYFCENRTEADIHAKLNHCVAIPLIDEIKGSCILMGSIAPSVPEESKVSLKEIFYTALTVLLFILVIVILNK